jgi:hypothetical protein
VKEQHDGAIARFDQVEGADDAEHDQAWKRIVAAARRHDVEVSVSSWRDLAKGGRDHRRLTRATRMPAVATSIA